MLTAGVLPQPPASRRNGSNSILVRPNTERPWWKFSNTRSISRRRVFAGSAMFGSSHDETRFMETMVCPQRGDATLSKKSPFRADENGWSCDRSVAGALHVPLSHKYRQCVCATECRDRDFVGRAAVRAP